MLEGILELLLEFCGELLIQMLVELVSEFGIRRLIGDGWADRRPHPVARFFGYSLLGAIVGAITVGLMPHHLLRTGAARLGNLVLTPILAGAVMAWLGRWRSRRDQVLIGLDRFWCGWGFAFAVAGVRYFWCG